MQKILVIGGTGMLGKLVAQALIQAGFDVSLLARDVAKTQKLFPGATILPGDVFDPLSLLKAFEGQDAVYISLSPPRTARRKDRMPEREGIDNIVRVAQRTDIGRIALLSSLVQGYNGMNGFHWWVFDIKQAAVEKIKNCGIPYTIFYPSSFMECFDHQLLMGKRLLLAGRSEAPMYMIAAADYARMVARSFEQLTWENKEYVIQGTVPYTWDEGTAIFLKHYPQGPVKITRMPLGIMKAAGTLIPYANNGWHILEALNKYPETFDGEQAWHELGKPVISLAEYAGTRS